MAGIRSQVKETIQRDSFDSPYLVVCEGRADAAFFNRLFRERNIGNFQIDIPLIHGRNGTTSAGNTCFGEYLKAVRTEFQLNPNSVRAIILATDCDTDPTESFVKVQRQIQNANAVEGTPKYGVPATPTILTASENGLPGICIVMLPGSNEAGELESLCKQPAIESSPATNKCIDQALACASIAETAKLRLRLSLALSNPGEPNISIGRIWEQDSLQELIPVKHGAFDPIANFFSTFTA